MMEIGHLLESLRDLCEAGPSVSSYKNAWGLLVAAAAKHTKGASKLKALIEEPSAGAYNKLIDLVFPDAGSIKQAMDSRGWRADPDKVLSLLRSLSDKVASLRFFTPDEVTKHYDYLQAIDLPDEVSDAVTKFYPDWSSAAGTVNALSQVRISKLLWPFLTHLISTGKRSARGY